MRSIDFSNILVRAILVKIKKLKIFFFLTVPIIFKVFSKKKMLQRSEQRKTVSEGIKVAERSYGRLDRTFTFDHGTHRNLKSLKKLAACLSDA